MRDPLNAPGANELLDLLQKASQKVPDGDFTRIEELDIAECLTKARLLVSNRILRAKRGK
jgi:hypothetical protein